MSLSVLKRKAGTKYGKLSSQKNKGTFGNVGFSINNPRRVESHKNQPQIQTPMKGNVARGHGSKTGVPYPKNMNLSQYVNYDSFERNFNNGSNQGISVKNNAGSISTQFKWIKRGYPHTVVKNTRHLDYDMYLKQLRDQSASHNNEKNKQDCICNNKAHLNYVKDVNTPSYQEYLSTSFLNKHCLPPPLSKQSMPLPASGPCNSCNGNGRLSSKKGSQCE
tara:strand:+ start:86 stop:745 length:660 start_codon:yes stop_codon:yes gene_type:complete